MSNIEHFNSFVDLFNSHLAELTHSYPTVPTFILLDSNINTFKICNNNSLEFFNTALSNGFLQPVVGSDNGKFVG